MPVHRWNRVVAGVFHHFHQCWIAALCRRLNHGVLPAGYYALAEQIAAGPLPDVVALETTERATFEELVQGDGLAIAVAEAPPRVQYLDEAEVDLYAMRADRIAIHHASGHQIVAAIEVVSPGNKSRRHQLQSFLIKLQRSLDLGQHLLVMDLHEPGPFDPDGLHFACWSERYGTAHCVTAGHPFALAAYQAMADGEEFAPKAYFEPIAAGAPLVPMPLFLTSTYSVSVPLEETYLDAWDEVPKTWRDVLQM